MPPGKHAAGCLTSYGASGVNPGELGMFVYIPETLPAGAPLVVVLHGCGQSASAYCKDAGWLTLADRCGFAVLAPGQNSANNFNGCFNWFQPSDAVRGAGEAASIAEMVEILATDQKLDRDRIYVTGLSAGGAMAIVMLAVYPEIFAGGAVIAGLAYGAAQNGHEALSVMRHPPAMSEQAWGDLVRGASPFNGPWPKLSVWQGDADWMVKPANADAILRQWINIHGVAAAPSLEETVDGYPHRVWRGRGGDGVLEAYVITGMGHGTPIAAGDGVDQCGAAGPYVLEAGISSSIRIAQFWGLDSRAAKPHPRVAQPRFNTAAAALPAGGRSSVRVQQVIEQALSAAGLLKRR